MFFSSELKNKMERYYTKYYRDDCCLSDYQSRVVNRLSEEENELKRILEFQKMLMMNFRPQQKHFIFGAGTGGLAITLFKEYDCDVYGIEPCSEEFEIIQQKCKYVNIPSGNFKKEFGESLSFPNDRFDFVHCLSVLEHVQDIKKCLKEMIRIVNPGGYIYIYTPNYNFPMEGHYKIPFPTFLPKIFGRFYLRLRGKSSNFLKTINYVTERQINKILCQETEIIWFRLYQPFERSNGRLAWIFNFLKFNLFVYHKQEIIIKKFKSLH